MDKGRLWLLIPREVRELPADIAAVFLYIGLTNLAVFLPVLNESPVRVVVGLGFVLFVPGYAFIAALFPEAGAAPVADADTETTMDDPAEPTADPTGLRDRGIDGIERVALSFGLSIAIVPLLGLVLNFTPFGIRLVPIVVTITVFTGAAAVVAALRRWELPESERFAVPYRSWIGLGREELLQPDSRVDAALNVVLVAAILLATSSVVYAVAVPPQGEQFTEFYVLTEDEDGELVAADYPETLVTGEPQSLHVGIENNEYRTVDYTVIMQLQRVATSGNETTVTERRNLDRFETTLEHNTTSLGAQNITAPEGFTGSELRLTFLLYTGDPPATPTRENAYRNLHLWVAVESGDSP